MTKLGDITMKTKNFKILINAVLKTTSKSSQNLKQRPKVVVITDVSAMYRHPDSLKRKLATGVYIDNRRNISAPMVKFTNMSSKLLHNIIQETHGATSTPKLTI